MKISLAKIKLPKRKVHQSLVKELCECLRKNGQRMPLLLWRNRQLRDGLHRVLAMRLLGWEQATVIIEDK
jgi:ParB-like chromosome segregation protein Spo0J